MAQTGYKVNFTMDMILLDHTDRYYEFGRMRMRVILCSVMLYYLRLKGIKAATRFAC